MVNYRLLRFLKKRGWKGNDNQSIILYVIDQKPLNIFSFIAQLLILNGALSEMPLDG
jgi:hypothetical protein